MFGIFMAITVTSMPLETVSYLEGQLRQETFDQQAIAAAKKMAKGFIRHDAQAIDTVIVENISAADSWHLTSDKQMRSRSGYWTPENYQFHKAASVDLDGDGCIDKAEFVENSQSHGLRIDYCNAEKASRIIVFGEGGWSDQGVFSAGKNIIMINFPESRSVCIFEKRGRLMANYIGD